MVGGNAIEALQASEHKTPPPQELECFIVPEG
jgi:hypothetical protein